MSRRSSSMSMNWKIFWRFGTHGHVFPRNRSAFCSCLDSHLSAQELENGRLAMFAFSGIVTQVAQWSEMWVVFSKAKATLHKVFLSLSLSLQTWMSILKYPYSQNHFVLIQFWAIWFSELVAYDILWGDMYSGETRIRVQCSTFLCRSIAEVSTGKLLQFAASCYKHSWTTIVRPPLVFGFSVFRRTKCQEQPKSQSFVTNDPRQP